MSERSEDSTTKTRDDEFLLEPFRPLIERFNKEEAKAETRLLIATVTLSLVCIGIMAYCLYTQGQ